MGAAPTGKTVFLKGVNIFRVRDGHLFHQLGMTGYGTANRCRGPPVLPRSGRGYLAR